MCFFASIAHFSYPCTALFRLGPRQIQKGRERDGVRLLSRHPGYPSGLHDVRGLSDRFLDRHHVTQSRLAATYSR